MKMLKNLSNLKIFKLLSFQDNQEKTNIKEKSKSNDFLTKEKERKRKWTTKMKKEQERHARHKQDAKLKKWSANKKNRRSLILRELLMLFMFKRLQKNHLHQPLALHFCADNLFIGAFQELTCIYQRAPTKRLKLFSG